MKITTEYLFFLVSACFFSRLFGGSLDGCYICFLQKNDEAQCKLCLGPPANVQQHNK